MLFRSGEAAKAGAAPLDLVKAAKELVPIEGPLVEVDRRRLRLVGWGGRVRSPIVRSLEWGAAMAASIGVCVAGFQLGAGSAGEGGDSGAVLAEAVSFGLTVGDATSTDDQPWLDLLEAEG